VIENHLDINKIIPYDKQSVTYIDGHSCLFKLHGDAHKYIATGDKKYLILDKNQYIDSIESPENYDMRNHLETDFAGSHIIFIGCGLEDEMDLMFAAHNSLNKEIQSNSEATNSKIIYVYYKSDGKAELSVKDELKLLNYVTSLVDRA
jgi:hypothetical protein